MKYIQRGQALVSLLVFMVIAIVITTGAIFVLISGSVNTSKVAQGSDALSIAEAGAENALIRILRDTSYTGETVEFENGDAVITVEGTNPYTITSIGIHGNFRRTVEVTVEFVDNKMTMTNWEEVF